MAGTTISTNQTLTVTLTTTPVLVKSGVSVTAVPKLSSGNVGAVYAYGTNVSFAVTNDGFIEGKYAKVGGQTVAQGAIYFGSNNGATVASAVLINNGTIKDIGTGNAIPEYAVFINSGTGTAGAAAITNNSGAAIIANAANVAVDFGQGDGIGTVVNYGIISNTDTAGGFGVSLADVGFVTNASGGTISASTAGTDAGVYLVTGSVTNAGVIIGGTDGAVDFGDNTMTNRVIVDPGASFTGKVNGGGGYLELGGSSASTLGTFGSTGTTGITNFTTLHFDSGSKWTVIGAGTTAFGGIKITGFTLNDTIEITGFKGTVASYSTSTGLTLSNTTGTIATLDFTGGNHSLTNFSASTVASGSGATYVTFLCFARGTKIATPDGEVNVQQLAVGDIVRTLDGKDEPIVWIGTSRVHVTPGRRNATTPIIVHKGALAPNVPHADLRLTKGHSLYLDDVLIPVECLVNHRSICWDDRAREIEIYHIELARHAVLIAEGAPAESYRDDGNLWLFSNAEERSGSAPTEPCAPILTGGPMVDAIWRRLLDRSGPRPGLPTTDDPDLHLLVDGQRIDGYRQFDGTYAFHLTQQPNNVRIVSRSAVPEELGVSRDPRSLGVAVLQIVVRQGARLRVIEAADPSLCDGFHLFEAENGFRWTDGEATLPQSLFSDASGPCELTLHVACAAHYALYADAA